MDNDILKIEGVSFSYNEELVLDKISFDIKKGEFLSVLGPNGSGKSTLLKLLNNIIRPDSGVIYLKSKDIKKYKLKDLAKEISWVPQNTFINYDFLVKDIVMMGRYPYKNILDKTNNKDIEIVNEAMNLTNTYQLRNKKINEISGGERQRVIISRAIAQNTDIILLDEPMSNLDINHQLEIMGFLKNINIKNNITIVIVIHDINLATRYSSQILMLNDKKVLSKGKPNEIITNKNLRDVYHIDSAIDINKHINKLEVTPIKTL